MKHSAGILLFKKVKSDYEILIVHPGGPFWAKKDLGAWSMPKGEYDPEEDPLHAAKREFEEEVGSPPPEGDYIDLGEAKQPSGKIVQAFALQADFDLKGFRSNTVELEWPPKSGRKQNFPEADKAGWFGLAKAKKKLVKGQVVFVDRLTEKLGVDISEVSEPVQGSLF